MTQTQTQTRAALYARVSSDDTGKDGRNLAGQLEMCREYAQGHGWEIIGEYAEDSRGASGAEINLPELTRIRDMAAAGDFDVLVVRELDRLSRNLAKQLIVEEELDRAGVEIKYVLGEYDDSPEGTLQKLVKGAVAEYERLKIAERMTRGRRRVVKDGRIMLHGDRPPFGYRRSEDGQNLAVYEPEAEVVRTIYHWYVNGNEEGVRPGIQKLAGWLTELNIPTWNDTHRNGKNGCTPWGSKSVIDILGSETYRGTWLYGRRNSFTGEVNPRESCLELDVPPIVSRELWTQAQRQRKLNKTRAKRNTKREYLLARRMRCRQCGSSINGYGSTVDGKRYQYYRCRCVTGGVPTRTCNLPSFRVDKTDAAIWDWVTRLVLNTKATLAGLLDEQAAREKDCESLRRTLAATETRIADTKRKLERALDAYLDDPTLKEMLEERTEQYRALLASFEEQKAKTEARIAAKAISDDQIRTIMEFTQEKAAGLDLAAADFAKRRQLIDDLDLTAELAIEDGAYVVHLECRAGHGRLPDVYSTIRSRIGASD